MTAVYYGGLISFARIFAIGVIGRLNGWKRYDRDTYLEMEYNNYIYIYKNVLKNDDSIGGLPPGEVM